MSKENHLFLHDLIPILLIAIIQHIAVIIQHIAVIQVLTLRHHQVGEVQQHLDFCLERELGCLPHLDIVIVIVVVIQGKEKNMINLVQ